MTNETLGSALHQVFKKVFILIDQCVVQLVGVHAIDQGLEIRFGFYLDSDQRRTGLFVVFLDKFESDNIIVRPKDIIDEFFV